MREEWPSLPATLQASASGSKLSATAKDFTPPVSEHGVASGTPAEAAEQLQYRPYVPQPMPAPQVWNTRPKSLKVTYKGSMAVCASQILSIYDMQTAPTMYHCCGS